MFEVLHSFLNQPSKQGNLCRDEQSGKRSNTRTKKHLRRLSFFFFEDNEAVILTFVVEGRSPTMRHVSGTHRVALDWLFDRINLDPKIQIKYVDTTNHPADIETKGSFTLDEWNHLLRLSNIMDIS